MKYFIFFSRLSNYLVLVIMKLTDLQLMMVGFELQLQDVWRKKHKSIRWEKSRHSSLKCLSRAVLIKLPAAGAKNLNQNFFTNGLVPVKQASLEPLHK